MTTANTPQGALQADADAEIDEARAEARGRANGMISAGLGIGAIGVATGALLGAVCPVCVVAAPALVGVGTVKRWRYRRREERTDG